MTAPCWMEFCLQGWKLDISSRNGHKFTLRHLKSHMKMAATKEVYYVAYWSFVWAGFFVADLLRDWRLCGSFYEGSFCNRCDLRLYQNVKCDSLEREIALYIEQFLKMFLNIKFLVESKSSRSQRERICFMRKIVPT